MHAHLSSLNIASKHCLSTDSFNEGRPLLPGERKLCFFLSSLPCLAALFKNLKGNMFEQIPSPSYLEVSPLRSWCGHSVLTTATFLTITLSDLCAECICIYTQRACVGKMTSAPPFLAWRIQNLPHPENQFPYPTHSSAWSCPRPRQVLCISLSLSS